MGAKALVFGVVLLISFTTFVIFFGRLPALRNTPIGVLHRLLAVHLPRGLYALDQRLTNGQMYMSSSRLIRYLLNDRHPTVLVLFILLLLVSEFLFVPQVLPTLSIAMQLVSIVIILAPYVFLFLASSADPGYVTRETHSFHDSLYPYDHTLYLPGNICRTCKHTKPARSKHCKICGYCIAKADHHCIFINNCVGYGNQHWFLLLLMFTGVLTAAGTILGGRFVFEFIKTSFPSFSFLGKNLSWAQYFAFWSFALAEEAKVGGVTLLCLLTTPLVWALLGYNMYLLYRGMTTNESGKWQDFQADMDEGYIFRRPLPPSEQDGRLEARLGGWPKIATQTYAWMDAPSRTDDTNLPGKGRWHRNWSLEDVDNTYDIGIVGSMLDVFLPRSYLKSWYEDSRWRQ